MICLDSSFIIDFLRKDVSALKCYESFSDELFVVSEITLFEVASGFLYSDYKFKKKDFLIFVDFISNFEVLSTQNLHSFEAAKINASLIHQGEKIDSNDCVIAGTMLVNGVSKILTRNKKHFSKIRGIEVLSY